MRDKITAATVAGYQDEAIRSGLISFVYDTELTNFGCKLYPSGKVSYFVEARIGGRQGKNKRVTIGNSKTLIVDKSRLQAKIDIGKLASGLDITLKRKALVEQQLKYLSSPWARIIPGTP